MLKFKLVEFPDSEGERVLLDGNGEVVLAGDYYHDKIEFLIEGFFLGLDYAGEPYEVETEFLYEEPWLSKYGEYLGG